MKAVLDTSVYVSYLLSPRGAGAWLMSLWRDRRFSVVISDELHFELVEVLERPHLATRLDPNRRFALMRRLRLDAIWTPGSLDARDATPDPDDDKLVSAALEAQADLIVTWDQALLGQQSHRNIRFVTPDQFISAIVRKDHGPDPTD